MKQETITLGDFEYKCTALSARAGTRVAARLANALAPAVKALPEDGFELAPTTIAQMIEPVLTNPDLAGTLDFLIDTFGANTMVINPTNGNEQPLMRVFDVQFSDGYDHMISWLVFSVRLSLSSFFRGARGLGALIAQAGLASKSPSPAAQTGKSGG